MEAMRVQKAKQQIIDDEKTITAETRVRVEQRARVRPKGVVGWVCVLRRFIRRVCVCSVVSSDGCVCSVVSSD
eukprot:631579-Prorocentrum_minimum.AAC.1